MAKNSTYKNSSNFFPGNKKGLSAVVITVILIALSIVAIVVVWTFVNSMIKKQISSSESCFGNFDKIKINKQYTCYEKISDTEYKLRFSLSIGDIEVDKVIVSVSSANAIESYEITNEDQQDIGLDTYPSGGEVKLPAKNAGLTYLATGFTSEIDLIQIAPVIGGNQCEISDSVSYIENCLA
jgi:hypothetical protein